MYIQSIKFAATGIINTLVSFVVYTLLFSVFQCPYTVSLIFAYLFGILNSYIWNSKWTFKSQKAHCKEFLSFILVYLSTFFMNLLILGMEIKILKINGITAQGIALTIAAFFSFIGYKFWVFRERK